MTLPIIICGAGHAGVATASELRLAGLVGPILLIGQEGHLPYQRPHLSKECLTQAAPAPTVLKPAAFYEDKGITLLTQEVTGLDLVAKSLTLADGTTLEWAHFVFATGALAQTLPAQIMGADRALVLRNFAQATNLQTKLEQAKQVVIIGGGMIGLEVAAMARLRGLDVTVIEANDRLMARSLHPALAQILYDRHSANGIDIRLNTRLARIEDDAVITQDGARLAADLVLNATGSRPATALAARSGLACDDGIVVDARGASTYLGVWAVGDCARWADPEHPKGKRHESVTACNWQAKAVAAAICKRPAPAATALRLWSQQGGLRVQMSGDLQQVTAVELSPAESGHLLSGYHDDRLIVVQALDAPRAFNLQVGNLGRARAAGLAAPAACSF